MLKHLRTVLLGFIALSVSIASAQEACSAIVEDALFAVDEFCGDLGRNQACYGNIDLTAEAQPDATDFSFESLGDIVDVADIQSLQLSAFDQELGTWGVAVMSLQADIPNTLPGQNVTFILFGDVSIENAATDEQTPMQAFYLRTGIGDVACEDAPESGLLIQTPDGVDEVTFNVNGVDVQVGSTVLFQTETVSDTETELFMSTIEGSLAVQFDDEIYPVIEGTWVSLPLNNELLPTGRPGLPEAYNENRIAPLPIAPLPRPINPAPPLAGEELTQLRDRIQNGLAPCGVEGLPPCANILPVLQTGENLPPPNNWGVPFEAGLNCINRPEMTVDSSNLPPVLGETQALPFCPPADRASRPAPIRAVANNELPFDADEDADGVLNADDACPLRAGLVEFNGCNSQPIDSDRDGLVDALDYCPYRAGDQTARGCPEAPQDNDGDGFPNALDVCPNRAGTAEFRGCPQDPRTIIGGTNANCADATNTDATCPRDSDGDGIRDGQDSCPARAGTPENNGCPARTEGNTATTIVTATPVQSVVDSDGDGVADNVDACPNYSGSINGCPPDSDGDGLYDPQDNCPNQFGPAATNGCPPPDRDNDGVPDGQDSCPDQTGPAANNGCPLDRDGDGIADAQDSCPNVAGVQSRNGCPEPTQDSSGANGNGSANPTPDPNGDFDRDGVLNGQDRCPQTPGSPNNNGCPVGGN